MRSDMIPGAVFPDYELSDHTAKRRQLSELQGLLAWSTTSVPPSTGTRNETGETNQVGGVEFAIWCRIKRLDGGLRSNRA